MKVHSIVSSEPDGDFHADGKDKLEVFRANHRVIEQ
jgi:hypothetical protein